MQPAPFEYHAASTVENAVGLLHHLPGAKVLAGGLSLVPELRRRQVRPRHLVDINRVHSLAAIEVRDGAVSVGSVCRQADLLRWAGDHDQPLLADALNHTGTGQTRRSGTVAGIVAQGNPATQLAAVCAIQGATVRVRSADGERSVPTSHIFASGGLAAAGYERELIVTLDIPLWTKGDGYAFLQAGRRAVGATMGGVAARVRLDSTGQCVRADVAPFLPGHDGTRLPAVAARLAGTDLGDGDIADAARIAARSVRAVGDVLATADYRRHLVEVLVRRALTLAARRAKGVTE